jgi:hypothetical protein
VGKFVSSMAVPWRQMAFTGLAAKQPGHAACPRGPPVVELPSPCPRRPLGSAQSTTGSLASSSSGTSKYLGNEEEKRG